MRQPQYTKPRERIGLRRTLFRVAAVVYQKERSRGIIYYFTFETKTTLPSASAL